MTDYTGPRITYNGGTHNAYRQVFDPEFPAGATSREARVMPRWRGTSQYRAQRVAERSLQCVRTSPKNPVFGRKLTLEEVRKRIQYGY